MVKKKLIHFAENFTFDHLFQQSYEELMAGFPLRGKWNADYFRNNHPITLELGCGKGEYTVSLARNHPEMNFIGVDIKGARLWRGCKTVEEEKLKNVAFVRTKIELINHFFGPGEIDTIWITFPDPQPRKRKERKRLTSPRFLDRYKKIIREGGVIHLKTDNTSLFEYTLDVIRDYGHQLITSETDLYCSSFEGDATTIKTFYEEIYIREDKTIKYLQFSLKDG